MEGVAMSTDSAEPPDGSQMPRSERRTVPRYSLIATAEVIEPVSEVRISGRISEISRKGVYVDILNPLPRGTRVNIRISRDQGTFAATGKVIYVQEGMGMGVLFLDVANDQEKLLDSWLAELKA
jgi:PilZ domain